MSARPPLPPGPFLVVGLARSGVAAALALRGLGAEVVGCDAAAVAPGVRGTLEGAGVPVHAPDDGVALVAGAPTVVKSPGVPQEAPAVALARESGRLVVGELEIAWRLLAQEFVAVTGSNGKTTTVELLGHVHREAGVPVVVAGNVGTPLASLAGRSLAPGTVIVCEASSFQLEDTQRFAPEAAVLLNLAEDHLDRHGSFEAYRDAKLEAFARQGPDALAVLPDDLDVARGGRARVVRFGSGPDADLRFVAGPGRERGEPAAAVPGRAGPAADLGGHVAAAGRMGDLGADVVAAGPAGDPGGRVAAAGPAGGQPGHPSKDGGVLTWRGALLMAADEIRLRGAHNRANAMAAAAVALARGLDPHAVRAALAGFAGVPHRLEEVATRAGVLYVNDSKATNVASAVVGIGSFAGGVHAILGGRGKGGDYAPLAAPVAERCVAVYLVGEAAAELREALEPTGVPLLLCVDLERAVAAARTAARPGEVVLLSPACASYDQYRSFEERGAHFRTLATGG